MKYTIKKEDIFVRSWISKPVRVTFALIVLLIITILYASRIKLGYLPASDTKSIMVHIEYQGAFETEIERVITNPLERELSGIEGIKEIFSVSEQGKSRVNISFFPETDLNRAYLRVREVVDYIYANMPQGVQRPRIIKSDINSRPVFIAAFEKSSGLNEDDYKRIFENIEGTGEIEIGGGYKKEILIRYNPFKAASGGLSVFSIIQALRTNNVIGGFGKETETASLLDGRLFTLEDFEQLRLNKNIVLNDIASVSIEEAEKNSIGTVNGKEKVIVYVNKAGDSNTVLLCRELSKLSLNTLKGDIIYNYGEKIESALNEILILVLTGIILVIVLTLVFLRRIYPALLVSLNIPFSIIITTACLSLSGHELNLMTLSGIAIGVGLVIDTGIIFIEAFLENFTEKKIPLLPAISKSLKITKIPIIFSSLTTVSVFVPLIFAEQVLINQFSPLAVSVVSSIAASVVFVFIFMPAFIAGFYKNSSSKYSKKIKKQANYKFLKKIFFFAAGNRSVFIPCIIAVLFLSLFFFSELKQVNFVIPAGNSVSLTLEYKSGSSLGYVYESASKLESIILSIDDVSECSTKYEKERADFDITLHENTDLKSFINLIKAEESGFEDVFFYFHDLTETEAEFKVVLTGQGNHELRQLASMLSEEIRNLPYVDNIIFHFKEVIPSKLITVNLSDSKRLGMDPYNIYSNLYWALSKPVASKWNPPGEEADIKVFSDKNSIENLNNIMHLRFLNNKNEPVELCTLSDLTEMDETGRIYHQNRQRSVSFSVSTGSEYKEEVLQNTQDLLNNYTFPEGYRAEAGLSEKDEKRIQVSACLSLVISIILIMLILVFQFEGIKIPLIIIMQIPLSFILPVCLIYFFKMPLSLPVLIGMILTAGISVNNSILIFDRIKKLNSFSVFIGLKSKLKAILIASLTTILGVFPLFFSGESSILSQLSFTMAAGITGSILFLIITLPLLFNHPKLFIKHKK